MTQLFPSVRKGPYSDPIFSPNRSSNFTFRSPPTYTMSALLTDPVPFNLPSSTSVLIQWTGPQSFSPTTPSGLTSAIDVGDSLPPLIIGTFSDWCAPLLTLGRLPDHIFEIRWKPGIMASSTIFPLPFSRLNSILTLRKYSNYFPPWPRRLSSLRCLMPHQIQYSIVYGPFSKRTLSTRLGIPFSRARSFKVSSLVLCGRRCSGILTFILSSFPPLPSWNGRCRPLRNWWNGFSPSLTNLRCPLPTCLSVHLP